MYEFIDAISSPFNLTLTICLVVMLGYWLMVIAGALGLDTLDLDLDGEPELDLDTDIDADHGPSLGSGSVAFSFARFFNVGEVPLMILLSIFVLALWTIGVLSYPWVGQWALILQLLVFLGFAVAALFLTKLATAPLATVFRKIKEQEAAEQAVQIIGKRGVVVSGQVTYRYGQVQIDTNGAPLRLNARTGDTDTVLNKGDEAVIVSRDADHGFYLVRGFLN